MSKTIKHILIIRLSAMGDVAMTVPILRALTQQFPEVKITVLTREYFTPFFRDLPNISLLPVDVKGKHKGLLGLYKLSKDLKRLNIDAVADLHNVLRSKILKVFLFGIKCVQIDKGRAEKKALTSGKCFHKLKTTHQRYADVFEKLGYKLDMTNPIFPERAKLNNKMLRLFGEAVPKKIGIAPFAAYEGKMYPMDLMNNVIAQLSKKHHIVLFGGGQQEIDLLNNFENNFENVINTAGRISLNEELDLISNLDVMLSMDSGNAHLAAMLGIKVVTIWGVTHPFAGFAPFNQPEDYALLPDRIKYPKLPTSIYGNKYPDDYKDASRSISPEMVVNKIESVI